MRISDWSSDVCSSDLDLDRQCGIECFALQRTEGARQAEHLVRFREEDARVLDAADARSDVGQFFAEAAARLRIEPEVGGVARPALLLRPRSEERRVGKEWVSPCRSRW